jgi:hypothetical protein
MVFLLWFFIIQSYLRYTYKTRTNWKTDWNGFMNSNLSLIKFNVSTTSGSNKIKLIFNLLPHAVTNVLINVCTGLSDPYLELMQRGDVDIVLRKTLQK